MTRGSRRGVSAATKAAALLVALLVSIPLAYLLVRAASGGGAAWAGHVLTRRTLELLAGTLSIVCGVAALTVLIAVPFAWLVTRTDLPGRRFWSVAGALPLVYPSYVAAFTFVAILGPRGEIAMLVGNPFPEVVYGWSGALLTLGLFSYPYLYLLLVAKMKTIDTAQEEAARTLGRSPLQVFFEVFVPQLRVPLAAGLVLVTLYVISDFGAVSIVRYDTFTTAIYDAYRGLFDRTVAAMLGTVLVALTSGVLLMEWFFIRRVAPQSSRLVRRVAPVALGPWKVPALVFVGAVTIAAMGVPLAAITIWVVRALSRGSITLDMTAAWNSVSLSMVTAVVAVVFSIPVAVWVVRGGGRAARITERLTFSGYALPGIVIALSLVFLAIRVARPLYQTVALLVAAYAIRFLPEAIAATRSALMSVSPAIEEAARTLGSGRLKVLTRVTLPMIRPGLLAGAGLVFLTAMKELPATLILRPTGFETLATRIWSEAAVSAWSGAAGPSLLLLVVSGVPIWLLVIRPVIGDQA